MPDTAELFALATEIRRDHPELSLEQALDVAVLELEELLEFAGDFDARALINVLQAWDTQAAAAGNPIAHT